MLIEGRSLFSSRRGGRSVGGVSARAGGEAVFLPEAVPVPDGSGSGLIGEAITELVGEHEYLAAVVGLVGEHVGEHGSSGGPWASPAAEKFFDFAVGRSGERVGKHAEALRSAFAVRGGGLLHGAGVRVEPGRAFEMRGTIAQPQEAAVVQVREDGGDGSRGFSLYIGRLRAPDIWVDVGEQELIHGVVDGVGFDEDGADVVYGWLG